MTMRPWVVGSLFGILGATTAVLVAARSTQQKLEAQGRRLEAELARIGNMSRERIQAQANTWADELRSTGEVYIQKAVSGAVKDVVAYQYGITPAFVDDLVSARRDLAEFREDMWGYLARRLRERLQSSLR
jgi:gas vesicle protein